jgi:hypothetical protein
MSCQTALPSASPTLRRQTDGRLERSAGAPPLLRRFQGDSLSRPNSGEIHWPITHPDGQRLVSLRSVPQVGPLPVFGAPHRVGPHRIAFAPSISHNHGSPYGAPPPASEAETVHSMVMCALFSLIVRRSEIICRRMCAAHGREHGVDQRGCSDNNSTYIQPNLIHGVLLMVKVIRSSGLGLCMLVEGRCAAFLRREEPALVE